VWSRAINAITFYDTVVLVIIEKKPALHFSQAIHGPGRTLEELPRRLRINTNLINSGLGFVLFCGNTRIAVLFPSELWHQLPGGVLMGFGLSAQKR